ncbi:hypothetical protein [Piscinibacter sakaiensis]|uniref:Transmembrane protein n=1 Tax=Piscinibacter sakaiensis TaxID=1547922 RepID=A0A0K8P6V2_PISS1|nr:hypothetical protein [Piscinibacter sakaiensis]GAP38249.1 hypothetical protein ISF6_4443 [Piscinibacter sakaiensis]
MSSLPFVGRPLHDLQRAVVLPFKAVFVVGLCGLINAMTYSGQWWVKWVALGMGIAVVVALARVLRWLLLALAVLWVGRWLQRRHGAAAAAAFEAWAARTPAVADALAAWRRRAAGGTAPVAGG